MIFKIISEKFPNDRGKQKHYKNNDWYKCEIPKDYNKQIRRIDYDI